MSGHDERLETERIANMYEVTRNDPDPGPLWPRIKHAAEWYGIIHMVRSFFH